MGSQLPDRNLKSRRDGAHYPFVAPSLSDFCPTLLGAALHLTVSGHAPPPTPIALAPGHSQPHPHQLAGFVWLLAAHISRQRWYCSALRGSASS